MSSLSIKQLRKEDALAVAKIHANELTYSFNSKLGENHLACIYNLMIDLPGTFVGVAYDGCVPVGVVSGTLNEHDLKSKMFGALNWWSIIGRIVCHPLAVFTLFEEFRSSLPIKVDNCEVLACLTSIAVANTHRRMGIASLLVTALEAYFRSNHVSYYRLDTIGGNNGARTFYSNIGFVEAAQNRNTMVFVKNLSADKNYS